MNGELTFKKKGNKQKKPLAKPIYEPVNWSVIINTFKESRELGRQIQVEYALLYLTGARVSEITQLRKSDFAYVKDNSGREVLTVKLPTLKNQREKYRILPLVKVEPYTEMIEVIEKYLEHLNPYHHIFKSRHRMTMSRKLKKIKSFTTIAFFPKGVQSPKNIAIIEEYKDDKTRKLITRKWYAHFLRHCRLTHLVKYHNYDGTKLMFWAGWSDPRLSRIYVHLDWKSLADLIKTGQVSENY
jgi:site-specific recombinase XerD